MTKHYPDYSKVNSDNWKFATIGNLLEDAGNKLKLTLASHYEAFARDDNDVGECQFLQHTIDTGESSPFKLRPYRTSPQNQELIDAEITRLLSANIIEESDSAYASPGMLINKKDGSKRWVIDYRKLNYLTRKNSYTTPVIMDLLDALGGACIFSTLDFNSGYNQILIKKEDREKTAFVTKHGLFQFIRMPFGLCNAPATFQRLMDNVVFQHVFLYLTFSYYRLYFYFK